jgi:hypothetical protein
MGTFFYIAIHQKIIYEKIVLFIFTGATIYNRLHRTGEYIDGEFQCSYSGWMDRNK